MTFKNESVIIRKYLATDKKRKELVIKINLMNRIKTIITSFLFCSKIAKKVFEKNVEKVLTNEKRYSIMQIVPNKRNGKVH